MRHGLARFGEARHDGAWAAHDDAIFIGADLRGMAWHGLARRGRVRLGGVWLGRVWSGKARAALGGENPSVRICEARQAAARYGLAGFGGVGHGMGRT